MAASNEVELARMVQTAAEYNLGPISFRYPRGNVFGLDMPTKIESLKIGKGKIIKQGEKECAEDLTVFRFRYQQSKTVQRMFNPFSSKSQAEG